MRMACSIVLATWLGLLTHALAQAPEELAPVVRIKTGAVRGTVSEGVAAYKGIPFAAPPTGALRWQPPAPPQPWQGVRDATSYGAACYQFEEPAILPAGVAQSEDCLNLNVWAPAKRPRAPLPVMVWVHGGGLEQGTGAGPFYSGQQLAARGVIAVTINYRLGRLGFFAHSALTAENPRGPLGNYGVLDQIAALAWVKSNIAAFGGDPSRVTVFGESSGGEVPLYLLSSPLARGLFQRAIAQSGWPRWPLPVLRRAQKAGAVAAETEGDSFARKHGINETDARAAPALRALPVKTLQEDYAKGADFYVDGVVLPRPLFEAFATGHVARIPLMIGGTSWESNILDVTRESADSIVQRTGDRTRTLALYDPAGKLGTLRVAQDLLTDIEASEPNRRLAEHHAAHGARTFLYRFDYVPAARRASQPGATHMAEIPYVFGTLSKQPFKTLQGYDIPAATAEDWAMSERVMAYWIAFARTGDPAAAGGPRWPAYARDKEPMLDFGSTGPTVRERYNAERLDWLQSLAEAEK